MHPALSVIFFTTLSGAGYGVAFFLSLGFGGGLLSWFVSFALIVSGLLSSTLHLGNPQRALWAFTQWRSSWLSREGCMAVITFFPLGILALNDIFYASVHIYIMYIGIFCAFCCLVTVWCTGMIYASLRTVSSWHTVLTPLCYCGFCFSSGFLLLTLLTSLTTSSAPSDIVLTACLLFLGLGWSAKYFWWRRSSSIGFGHSDISTATGLGDFGHVRLLESPHSMDNYLTREMFFVLARRRRTALRRLALLFGLFLPLLSLALTLWVSPFIHLAFLFHFLGLLIERWLFFAESKHAVSLYYGAES